MTVGLEQLEAMARDLAADLGRAVPSVEDGLEGLVLAVDAWESVAAAWATLAELNATDEELRIARARAEQLRALATAATVRGLAVAAAGSLGGGLDRDAWARRFPKSPAVKPGGGSNDAT